jgi:glycosyltransferase involved in cell wall biosynthesis
MTPPMNKPPLVSIGVPVYNGQQFLSQTLDCLLAQTYAHLELIICDNCSADRTQEIGLAYAEKDPRVRYYRNTTNIGVDRNFNLAFSLSRGEYFKWASADEVCAPELVERCAQVLDAKPNVVLCYPKTRLIEESGAVVNDYEDMLDIQAESPNKRLALLFWNLRMCNAAFGLIRSSAIRQTRPYGSFSNSDLPFLAELILRGAFVEVPERLFSRRISSMSVQVYPSVHDRMVLFEPSRVGQLFFPNWKFFAYHVCAIHRVPMNWVERLKCYARMHILLKKRGQDLIEDLKFASRYVLSSGFKRSNRTACKGGAKP